LKKLCKEMDLDFYGKVAPGNNWKYIRSLLKNEVNNAKNWPIQTLAGHITNRGMLDTTRGFKSNNLDAWVFLQVHDEISCYAREDQAEQASAILKKGMEENIYAKGIDVPMIADPTICYNLKDAK
ncbi:MAG: DNA polymerase, partial [Flavobacteriaceae bacterium]|nr:DNA polymerase [Flavobacteriaceae bacterium]